MIINRFLFGLIKGSEAKNEVTNAIKADKIINGNVIHDVTCISNVSGISEGPSLYFENFSFKSSNPIHSLSSMKYVIKNSSFLESAVRHK